MTAGARAFCPVLMWPAAPAAQVKFVKSNKAAVVRLAVEKPICVELFSSVPQLVSSMYVVRRATVPKVAPVPEDVLCTAVHKDRGPSAALIDTPRCAHLMLMDNSADAMSRCALQGRFTLRDEGRTIAIGKIIKLPSGKKSVGDNAFSAT